MKPLISIITPTYNSVKFIEQTILSVKEQDYPNIEHIVVDGGSTDNTISILNKYKNRLRWISEPDKGQADAINKGLKMAKGDIVSWLNSDDLLCKNAFDKVVAFFDARPNASIVVGNLLYIDETGKFLRRSPAKKLTRWELLNGRAGVQQASTFFRRNVFKQMGYLDTSLHYVMDHEFWIRALEKFALFTLDEDLACFRLHAFSKTCTSENKFRLERLKVKRKHHAKFINYSTFYLFLSIAQEPLRRIRFLRKLVGKLKRRIGTIQRNEKI